MKDAVNNTSVGVGFFTAVSTEAGFDNDIISQLRNIGQPLFLSKNNGETKLYAGSLSADTLNQQKMKIFSGRQM